MVVYSSLSKGKLGLASLKVKIGIVVAAQTVAKKTAYAREHAAICTAYCVVRAMSEITPGGGCRQPGSAMVSPACAAALCQELLAWLSPNLVAAVLSTSNADGCRQPIGPCCWLRCLAASQQLLSAVATLQPKVTPAAASNTMRF